MSVDKSYLSITELKIHVDGLHCNILNNRNSGSSSTNTNISKRLSMMRDNIAVLGNQIDMKTAGFYTARARDHAEAPFNPANIKARIADLFLHKGRTVSQQSSQDKPSSSR